MREKGWKRREKRGRKEWAERKKREGERKEKEEGERKERESRGGNTARKGGGGEKKEVKERGREENTEKRGKGSGEGGAADALLPVRRRGATPQGGAERNGTGGLCGRAVTAARRAWAGPGPGRGGTGGGTAAGLRMGAGGEPRAAGALREAAGPGGGGEVVRGELVTGRGAASRTPGVSATAGLKR